MKVIRLMVGALGVNCYICACEKTGEAMVIDPGDAGRLILEKLRENKLLAKYIVNTHGHADHIGANGFLKENTGAKLLIHEADAAMLFEPKLNLSIYLGEPIICTPADRFLKDGDTISIGNETFTVLHTPGHTKGGISLVHADGVFTGDTLFAESIGRTDFPGGSMDEIIKSITEKLMKLKDTTAVFPGHGESSSIGHERKANPYL